MSSRSRIKALGAGLALATLVSGCSDIYLDRRDTIGLSAGDASASNRVAQMVDPWPPYSQEKNIAFNGEKMQTAVERYRHGKIIAPVNATTSSVAYQQAQATANATSNSQGGSGSGGAWAPPPTPTVK